MIELYCGDLWLEYMFNVNMFLPVVPHKAVAEVSE